MTVRRLLVKVSTILLYSLERNYSYPNYINPIEIGLYWAKIKYLKSPFKSLGLWSPNRYETDLLNEVLNIDFSQGTADISKVKDGGRKKIYQFDPRRRHISLESG